ncbi:putative Nucleoporin GLE2 (putative) [Pseudozyma hubeiensis]|nr:putative Nucleoporin GLE2 (putative) [Pseudozyma hubeiensis]
MSRPTSSRSSPVAGAASSSASSSAPDLIFPDPPHSNVSAVVFPPTPASTTSLLVSSWDHHVHHYTIDTTQISSTSAISKIQTFPHEAPVLDVCYITPTLAASASVDRRIRLLDLTTGKTLILGKHEDTITRVRWCGSTQMLISGSADRSVCFWEVAESGGGGRLLKKLEMPDKVIAMDVSPPFAQAIAPDEKIYSATQPGIPTKRDSTPRLVVATAGRHVHVYDLLPLRRAIDKERSGQEVKTRDWAPDQRRESSLKFMARDLRCMPAGDGYAMSSIEGRIAVEFFDTSEAVQSGKYAFKCHRETVKEGQEVEDMGIEGEEEMEKPYDVVFPVHGIAFHPRHGTFASLGGDSIVSVWDAAAKKRIRQYPKLSSCVTAGAFDPSGTLLLVATGSSELRDGDEVKVELVLKGNAWNECKPRLKSSSSSSKK